MWKNRGQIKRFLFIIIAVISLILPACQPNKPAVTKSSPQPNAASTPATPEKGDGRMIVGDFQPEKALLLLYGNYDAAQKASKWRPDKAKLEKVEMRVEDTQNEFQAQMVAATPYKEDNVEKYLILTQSTPNDYECRVCSPLIGGAIFVKDGNNWRLNIEQKYIFTAGVYGTAPEGKLTKIGTDRHGVLLETYDTHMGVETSAIVMVGEVNKDLKVILPFTIISQDNTGECGDDTANCWSYQSGYNFVPGKNPQYFDLKMSTFGTQLSEKEGGGVEELNRQQVFSFDGSAYKLTK